MNKDDSFSLGGMLQRLAGVFVPLLFVVVLAFPSTGFAHHKPGHKMPPGQSGKPGNSVPELNASQAGIALLLTTGGVLVLTGRRARQKK